MFKSKDINAPVDMEPFLLKVYGREQYNIVCEFMKSKGFPISAITSNGEAKPLYDDIWDTGYLCLIHNNHGVWAFLGTACQLALPPTEEFTFDEFIERYINPPKDPGFIMNINNDLIGRR